MFRGHSNDRSAPKDIVTQLSSPSACQSSSKCKSVSFPQTSLVTIVPDSEHSWSEDVDASRPDQQCSAKSPGAVNGHTLKCLPRPEAGRTPRPAANGQRQEPCTPTGLRSLQSPGVFASLRREQVDRAGSIEQLTDEEWKATTESYFEHEESARKYRESQQARRSLVPPSETSVSASNSRRYSAVVQQFMQKNGLVTPLPDAELVARQADQARLADPSYVSWGSVDLASDGNTPLPVTSDLNVEKGRPSSAAEPQSVDSFKVKSLFTPNQSIEPAAALCDVSSAASYTDVTAAVTSPASGQGLPPSAARTSVSSSSSESSTSQDRCKDCLASSMDNGRGKKKDSLWITPPRRLSSDAGSSHVGTPALHPSPLRPNHRQVLSISEESAQQQEKIRAQQRMGAVALIVLGMIIVVASVIAILVLLV